MISEDRHPLPASDEARGEELPEHLREEKGAGDDSAPATHWERPVGPDGAPYGEAPTRG